MNYKFVTDNIKVKDKNKIKVSKIKKNYIVIKPNVTKNSEIYVYFENLKFKPFNKEQATKNYLKTNFKKPYTKHQIQLAETENKWYEPNYGYKIIVKTSSLSKSKVVADCTTSAYCLREKDLLYNMGYYKNFDDTITISFSPEGCYTYDSIKVYAVDFDEYEKDRNQLNESNFKMVSIKDNGMEATIQPTKDGILQFSTFYDKGWKVYVDGKKVNTLKVNKYFLGISTTKGKHKIQLVYDTPYLKEGICLTMMGIVTFVVIVIVQKKKQKILVDV